MSEKITLEAILEQLEKMLDSGSFNLMLNRLERDPLHKKIRECIGCGKYELKFKYNTYCGLNFIHQRPVQCHYLDMDEQETKAFRLDLTNFHKYKIYGCRREKILFRLWFGE